jgi:DNA-binding SARP family transcriptional activator
MEAQRSLAHGRELRLIGGVHVVAGERRTEIPEGSRRLLVYVALQRRRADRRQVAGALWPVGGDERAAGNLRSALWRLRGAGLDLLDGDHGFLALSGDVGVDVEEVSDWATRLIRGRPEPRDLSLPSGWLGVLDLLPGWYDDWALIERERMRQRMLHALEALTRHLTLRARHAEAIDVAMVAIEAEPLRESAQRVLVEAHAAQGNHVEARRSYALYRSLVRRELGVDPSPELTALVTAPGRAGHELIDPPTRSLREVRHGPTSSGEVWARPDTSAVS